MATEDLELVVRERGIRRVAAGLNNVGTSAIHAGNSIYFLQRALAVIAGSLALNRLVEFADSWSTIRTKIDLATKSFSESAYMQERLFQVAQKTATPIADIVDLYSRARLAAVSLNATQGQLIQFTEGVAKALALQGSKSSQVSESLLQLGQLLGGAKVQAQEWNSIIDQTPKVLDVAARGFGEAGITVLELGQRVKKGEVSGKEFFEAFLKGAKTLDAEMNKVFPSFSRGFTAINNSFLRYIGQLNEASGASAIFGKVAQVVADNIDLIGASLVSVGILLAIVLSPAVLGTLSATMLALFSANWVVTLIAALVSAIAWINMVGSKIQMVAGEAATVKDVFVVLSSQIISFFADIGNSIALVLIGFGVWVSTSQNAVAVFLNDMYTMIKESLIAIYEYIDNGSEGMWWFVTASIKIGYAIVSAFEATVDTVSGLFDSLLLKVRHPLLAIGNLVRDAADRTITLVNSARTASSLLTGKPHVYTSPPLPRFKIEGEEPFDAGKNWVDKFNKGIADATPKAEKATQELIAKAAAAAEERLKKEGEKKDKGFDINKFLNERIGKLNQPVPVDDKAAKKAADERQSMLDKLRSSLESLRQTLDPLTYAQEEFKKGVLDLNQAQAEGMITAEYRDELLVRLNKHYKDILDPFGKVLRDIQEETDLLKLNADERAIATQIRKEEAAAMERFAPLSEDEIARLKEALKLQQERNKEASVRDSLQSGSLATEGQDFSRLLQQSQGLEKTDPNFTRIDTLKVLQGQYSELFEGTSAGLQVQLSQFDTYYARINEMEQLSIISAKDAAQMRSKVEAMQYEARIKNASQFFNDLSSLSTSSNRKLALIGKAAAVTQAIIQGRLAVQLAFASAGPPESYALAAAAAVQAAVNVASVAGVPIGFRTGGEFMVGGSGGPDSQLVAFRGSPGERVSVATPEQVRRGDPGNSSFTQEQKAPEVKVVNVQDMSLIGEYMSGKEGDTIFLNLMQRNKSALRTL